MSSSSVISRGMYGAGAGASAEFRGVLAPMTSCIAMICAVVWMRSSKPKKSRELRTVDEMATARYDAMIMPLHVLVQVLAAMAMFVRAVSVQTTNLRSTNLSMMGTDAITTLTVTGGTILATILLLRRSTMSLTPVQCVAVYRAAYLAGDWSFRLCRVYDVFAAADRAAFVVATADGMRAHFDLATQWACFTLGWLVGFMQPSSPPAWRICYFILATASPLVPAFMGWLVSSRFDWLQIGLRVLLLPQVVGFALEELQRCLVKKGLSSTIRNELAIALPSAPLASARRKRAPAKEGSRRRLATLPEKGEEVEDDGEDGPFAGLTTLATFEPLGVLGFGSSAQVRLMRDVDGGGELRAVKSIFKKRDGKPLEEKRAARVVEELAILNAAHDHPFIVGVHGAFEDAHCYHIVLEYCSNGSLAVWLGDEPFAEEIARLAAAEMVLALEHLHSLRIVYRDLKPENCLVRASGHIVLADFGISRRLEGGEGLPPPASATGGGTASMEQQQQQERERRRQGHSLGGAYTLVGTPGYMAPEVISLIHSPERSVEYSLPVDWWALGVMIHLLLTLEEALEHEEIIQLLRVSPDQAASRTRECLSLELSLEARGLVSRLLVFDPSRRLGTAGGAAEVRAHPFFASIDWERLRNLELQPPLRSLLL